MDDSDVESFNRSQGKSTTRSKLGSKVHHTKAQYPQAQRLIFANMENWDGSRLNGGIRAITFGADFDIREYVPPLQKCTNLTCPVIASISMLSRQSRNAAIPYGIYRVATATTATVVVLAILP